MFIGRQRELQALTQRYVRDGFEFPVIYGRRRVGKTRLLQEFMQGKPAVYFMATEQDERAQLRSFSTAIRAYAAEAQEHNIVGDFGSWEALFDCVTKLAEQQRLILAIDEFPYPTSASISAACSRTWLCSTCSGPSPHGRYPSSTRSTDAGGGAIPRASGRRKSTSCARTPRTSSAASANGRTSQ